MSGLPFNRGWKAISDPLFDQLGEPVSGPATCVNCLSASPSASAVQISSEPDRSDRKAIFLPSGEYCGSNWLRVEALSSLGTRAFGRPEAATLTDHRLMFVVESTYASR